jgi:1-acyl-sn-glycerol-3-phosphate acyltransferase
MEDKTFEYRKRIQHSFNAEYFESSIKWVDEYKLPQRLFDDYQISGLENTIKIRDKQVVYISNHISMSDFLIEAYFLWKEKLPFPRIIAGENLNYGFFRDFWKKCGAISVDRNAPRTNREYWRTYDNYVSECLVSGENLLNYPEGGRNKKEDLGKFKTGTFGQIVKATETGKDIFILPMHISYDKNPDHLFLDAAWAFKSKRDEALKKDKKLKVKIFNSVYFGLDFASYLYRILIERDKGACYLSFGQSFSVNDFLQSGGNKRTLATKTRDEIMKLVGLQNHIKKNLC